MTHLEFPFPVIPEAASLTTVAPGVHWLRMPLPFQLDHINLWLLEDTDGWTLVDTGLANDATRGIWLRIFADGFRGRPVVRVLVTHFHPDHMGLAGWLTDQWRAPMWATHGEWATARMLSLDQTAALRDAHAAFYRRADFPREILDDLAALGNVYATRANPPPATMHRLREGDRVSIGGREWRVIVGTGHSPEHACLYCEEAGVLISGDQVLPKITPIIGVWPTEPEGDPLRLYLDSLRQFADLPEDVTVLPSHGLPFLGLAARIRDIEHHHRRRLDHALKACAEWVTGWELLNKLFTRSLDLHQKTFALGESLAHVHYLMKDGRIVREMGNDGVFRYRRA